MQDFGPTGGSFCRYDSLWRSPDWNNPLLLMSHWSAFTERRSAGATFSATVSSSCQALRFLVSPIFVCGSPLLPLCWDLQTSEGPITKKALLGKVLEGPERWHCGSSLAANAANCVFTCTNSSAKQAINEEKTKLLDDKRCYRNAVLPGQE
jgi:hypothetical protein